MNSGMSTAVSALKRWRWLVVAVALAVPYAAFGYLLLSNVFANGGTTTYGLLGVGGVILAWLVNVMGIAALLEPSRF